MSVANVGVIKEGDLVFWTRRKEKIIGLVINVMPVELFNGEQALVDVLKSKCGKKERFLSDNLTVIKAGV